MTLSATSLPPLSWRVPRPWLAELAGLAALAVLISGAWSAIHGIKLAFAPFHLPAELAWREALRLWRFDLLLCAAMLAAAALGHRAVPRAGRLRIAGLVALVVSVTAVGVGLLLWQWPERLPGKPFDTDLLPYFTVRHGSLALLLVALREFTVRRQAAVRALHETEQARLALQRDLDAARLSLLQAQVEPHFLFNALANVRRLMRTGPDGAIDLLDALLRYLQEALPRLRDDRSTLGREAELVRAYLAVHQVRMGARLQALVDIPAELEDRPLPPLALLTLVENAIKHGLAPLPEGGRIEVLAQRTSAGLRLSVTDTGAGMQGDGAGEGTGLVNLQARLKALHGAAATLSLRLHEPRGMRAVIDLPEVPG